MNFEKIMELLKKDDGTVTVLKKMYKPSRLKCIIGFSLSIVGLILIFLLFGFQFNIFYFLILLIDLLFIAYYGINLFTKKGFTTPVYEKMDKNIYDKSIENNGDDVQ